MFSPIECYNDDWNIYLKSISERGQTQEDLTSQLLKLHQLATRAGLYDAADYLRVRLEKKTGDRK